MGQHDARQQKKLAKKKAKRHDKRREVARLASPSASMQLSQAESWPIAEALVSENLWEQGLGTLIISRRSPTGRLAMGLFLVDVYCLGVKNASWQILSLSDYQETVRRVGNTGRLGSVPPEYLAKLLQGAADFARQFGFAPHPDLRLARLLLADIDASRCTETFAFGMDGKPYYIQGPHESADKARAIAHQVAQAGGNYVLSLGGSQASMVAADNWRALPPE